MSITWSYGPLLGLTAGVTVGMQLLFFAIAYIFQFDKVTDISGSMNFVLIGWLSYCLGGSYFQRQTINTILLTVWGSRLGFYLLARVIKRGHDSRFDEVRNKFFSFLAFWVFQMMWAWIVTLPVILLNATTKDVKLNAQDYVGWALWGLGFVIEVWADQSKDNFISNPQNQGKIIMSTIWSWTRHPNYFGEITIWIGMFITCLSSFISNDIPGAFISVLSPIFTFALLMFASGCPLAEEKYNKRHGKEDWYLEYRRKTSPLIPMPPSLYRSLPSWIKSTFLFEYQLYAKGLNDKSSSTNETPLAAGNNV